MMTVKLQVLLSTATETGFTGDSNKSIRNRYFVINGNLFLELGAYDYRIKPTDMVNVMRFSEDKLGLLNTITVYSDTFYPCGHIDGKKIIHAYLMGRNFDNDNSMHVNHLNGIICDNANENLERVKREKNLSDRHIFTKSTRFEIRTEEAMLEMIDILNLRIKLSDCHNVYIKKESPRENNGRNPAPCKNIISIADFYKKWKESNNRKYLTKLYQIKEM